MSEREGYPFFVYGTLLPEQPNAYLWAERVTQVEPALFPDGELYDMGHFPMLIDGKGPPVAGVLLLPKADRYLQLLRALDNLEQYDPNRPDIGPYRRRARPVQAGRGRPVTAWVYLGQRRFVTGRKQIIPPDWARHSRGKSSAMQAWWRQPRAARDLRGELGKQDQTR